MVFIPRKASHLQNTAWNGDIIRIRASESIQLALNSTELTSLHLVVARSDQWQKAVDIFQNDAGPSSNIQLITRLARDEDLRLTFDQLPVSFVIVRCQSLREAMFRNASMPYRNNSLILFEF